MTKMGQCNCCGEEFAVAYLDMNGGLCVLCESDRIDPDDFDNGELDFDPGEYEASEERDDPYGWDEQFYGFDE